jgi:glycosyltransferase involved in cell wall biosynthesis
LNINLISPINQLGYGIASLGILKGLKAEGHTVALWIIGSQPEAPPSDHSMLTECIQQAAFYNRLAPSVRIWHQFDLAMHIGKGLHVGFPIFELNRFTDIEKHHLSRQELIVVPSEWAKQVVVDNNINTCCGAKNRIAVVPLGVDTSIFHPMDMIDRPNATIFMNVGKWEVRKGHDALALAFNEAFESSDNVQLILNCFNPFKNEAGNQEWINYYMQTKLGQAGKIGLVQHRLPSQNDLAQLMNTVDCGVFPARAEGWNLDLLEMMACGKPVICTYNTAHTEYANDKNALLVRTDKLEDAFDPPFFQNQGQWAELGSDQIDQLIEHMRSVHRLKQEGKLSVNEEGIRTAQQFSWINSARKLVEAIEPYVSTRD